MEQVVGGDMQHGTVVATLTSGVRLLGCRCRAVVHEGRWRSHIAQHRREHVVWRTSMDVNAAPRTQPIYQRVTPEAAQAMAAMQPKRGRRRGPRK